MRSLQGNLRPRPCLTWCIDRAIARPIHQGRGLRFPCNDRTGEINKLSIIWPLHYGPEPAIKKTNSWSAEKQTTSMSWHLSSRYSQVTLVSGHPFWQLSNDHDMGFHLAQNETTYIRDLFSRWRENSLLFLTSKGQIKRKWPKIDYQHLLPTLVSVKLAYNINIT